MSMKECPNCHRQFRAGEGHEGEKDGKRIWFVKLYCATPGCPMNNKLPVMIDEVEIDGTDEQEI